MNDKIIVEFDREKLKEAGCRTRRFEYNCWRQHICDMNDKQLLECNLDVHLINNFKIISRKIRKTNKRGLK